MTDRDRAPAEGVDEIEARLLLEAIYLRYHYDFRQYSMVSLKRRLVAARDRFGCATLSELQARMLREPGLFARLRDELTVQVSEMFRDPPYFRAVREQVVPVLATYPSIKIWVAGCSTGEEVYSLAIVLEEEGLLDRTIIYATDINVASLKAVERGVFPVERVADFSVNYAASGGRRSLSDYYTAGYNAAVFDRRLLRQVVLADHDLATDNVFAEVQFTSCRNVLIYFDRALQDRAIGLFSSALCRRGFLGLGMNESLLLSTHAASFSEFAREQRIYQKSPC